MSRYRGEILIILSTLAWGASYLFAKAALRVITPCNLVAIRFTVACAATALVFPKIARRIGRAEIIFGACLGTLLFASAVLLASGLVTTSISNAGFIIGSMVLFVSVMDALRTRTRPRPALVLGLAAALTGMGVLTLGDATAANIGDLLCLGATLTLALHVMVAQQAGKRADAIGASIVQFAATAVLAWGATWLEGGGSIVPIWPVSLYAVIMGLWSTAVAFVCQVVGQKYLSPTRTAFLFTLEPIFATLFAFLFAGEPIGRNVLIGGGLLLAGVYMSEFRLPNEKGGAQGES